MPKERFHIMLADLYLRSSGAGGRLSGILSRERAGFMLGAVSPDIFFYDPPSFALGPLGDRMHDLMERDGLAPLENWFSGRGGCPGGDSEGKGDGNGDHDRDLASAWAMGFASHFLADELWHPVINELAARLDFCRKKGLGELDCHRLIESEMESYFIPQVADGELFHAGCVPIKVRNLLDRVSVVYRDFLARAGLSPVPCPGRIRRCFLIQNYSLRLFSSRILGKWRDALLDLRFGRGLGALVVPDRPVLLSGWLAGVAADHNPFEDEFMKTGVISLNARLADFARRLERSLPS